MSAAKGSSWFGKFAFAVAFFLIMVLPAIYWACDKFLGVNLQRSAQGTLSRMFERFDSSSSGDDGGD